VVGSRFGKSRNRRRGSERHSRYVSQTTHKQRKSVIITDMSNAIIIHGTEGYPEENWFPWLKSELEQKGYEVIVPQFPSPPVVPAKISEWFDILKEYKQKITEDTLLIGHSLGGVFTLRILEKLEKPVKAAFFAGTPIGVKPILNYDRDMAFSGFDFDWEKIKQNALRFVVFQSDDDPYVGLENGKQLADKLGVELNFIPNAGHFNKRAGYTQFPELLKEITQ
jgi:predicted alpha/beta hydrolase family esterase